MENSGGFGGENHWNVLADVASNKNSWFPYGILRYYLNKDIFKSTQILRKDFQWLSKSSLQNTIIHTAWRRKSGADFNRV